MPAVHWRPEPNALTTPETYKARFMPNNILGLADIAARMGAYNPALTPDLSAAAISAFLQSIQQALIEGDQVSLEDALIIGLSVTGRLDDPDSPLPPIEECLHVRIRAAAAFVREIQHKARLERLDMKEKLPQINQVEDTTLQLDNVLSGTDILRLHGDNLNFDPQQGNGECVITGTRSGTAVQTQFGPITDTNIILIPTVSAQDDPWNNEYTLSLSVRYTEHGTLRTATYRRRLRSPLAVPGLGQQPPPETGILTGNAASPYVMVTGGELTADERLRIQVLRDPAGDHLLFSLLAMQEGGATGAEVAVTQNGAYTLPGFSGSAVSSLNITVNDYAALKDMIRNDYSGRLADVLDVKAA